MVTDNINRNIQTGPFLEYSALMLLVHMKVVLNEIFFPAG